MSGRSAWLWRGAAVLLAALPTLTGLIRFGRATATGWFAYSPMNTPAYGLDPNTALIGLLKWQQYTGMGIPVLIAAAPLVARGRWLRPGAAVAAVLLALVAAAGGYLGVYSGFTMLVDALTGVPGAGWAKPLAYLLAAVALAVVAVRGRPGGRTQPVISEAP